MKMFSLAQIFAHPNLSAEQLRLLCEDNGLEAQREPTGNFSLRAKRDAAIHWLRTSGPQSKYVIDRGSPKPAWGNGKVPETA